MITALRDYQDRGVAEIRAAYGAGARSILYVLPTGGGKTVVFSYVAKSAAERRRRSCIMVHRDTLLNQASAALTDCGVPHGIIAPGHTATRDLVQVASINTLARRLDRHEFDFLIPDEAHHATSPTWSKVLAAFPEAHVLGVTATPARTDGRGLAEIFEAMVLGPSIAELIEQGYLVRPVVYGSKKKLDLSRVQTRAGDYDRKQLAEAMDSSTITGDAVSEYSRLCPGAPAVVFCVSIRHAEDVAAEFAAAGYLAEVIHGKLPVQEIRAKVDGLRDGRVQLIVSVDLVSEGFDCPAIRAAILLRPTQSEALYIQQVGRALRPFPGKDRAIIIDHADNWFKHGGPAAPRDWTLEGRKKRPRRGSAEAAPGRQCEKCFCFHAPAPACPECGFVYTVNTLERDPDVVAGELREIDDELLQQQKQARRDRVRRARTLEDLQAVGREFGYKPAWASIVYQSRGGR